MAQQIKQSNVTTDHETIRKWAEKLEGKPACVKGTGDHESAGVLRIDFPGGEETNMDPISWDDFFKNV